MSDQQADVVGAHVLAAIYLADDDPALAYQHALAARRRASRLPIVRELAAETAYGAGEWADALAEYRAVRRMTGTDEVLATMADCERALGKPDAALDLCRQASRAKLSKEQRVELRIVEAGARADLGQNAEAERLLRTGIEEFIDCPPVAQARIRAAYAELLLSRDKSDQAQAWFRTAAQLDPEGESGAQDRLDELAGIGVDGGFDVFDDDPDEDPADLVSTWGPHEADALVAREPSSQTEGGEAWETEPEDVEFDHAAALAADATPEAPDVHLVDDPDAGAAPKDDEADALAALAGSGPEESEDELALESSPDAAPDEQRGDEERG